MHTRPVWVEISRHKLIANYHELRRMVRDHLSALGNAPEDQEMRLEFRRFLAKYAGWAAS